MQGKCSPLYRAVYLRLSPALRRGAFFMRYYGTIRRRPALPFASDVCYDALAQPSFAPVAWLRLITIN